MPATTSSQLIGTNIWPGLPKKIVDDDCRLLIAENDDFPVGTVRADLADGVYELSWTVAPGARGRGFGKQMVAMLANQIDQPIRAEIKTGNESSVRIAQYAGMRLDREVDGVLHFKRFE